MNVKSEYDLAIRSLGALKWYLKYCKIDYGIFSMKNFSTYTPPDIIGSFTKESSGSASNGISGKIASKSLNLILDSGALASLQIFPEHSGKSGANESLFGVINFCQTLFGQRLLKKWVACPLADPEELQSRLSVILSLNLILYRVSRIK